MKIAAISNYTQEPIVVNKRNRQYKTYPNKYNQDVFTSSTKSEISFKSVGGFIGGALGTIAGIGVGALLTAATGGLAAPMLVTMAGTAVGAIGGDIKESATNCSSDSEYDDFDDSYFDVRSWP